jgi:hypothetical protein
MAQGPIEHRYIRYQLSESMRRISQNEWMADKNYKATTQSAPYGRVLSMGYNNPKMHVDLCT